MATTSTEPILSAAISGLWFGVEDTQGVSMSEFTADGGANTGTAVTIDTTSGATDNNNASGVALNRFQGLQVIFDPATATAALQDKAYNVSASTVPTANIVTLTVDTMAATPAAGDTFKLIGRLPASEFVPNLETDILEREFMRDTLIGASSIPGNSFASGSFEMEAAGLVTAIGDGTTPVKDRYFLFLEQAYGERRAATGTAVSGSGSTTTVIDVSDASGFAVDDVVVISDEARIITAVDTASTPDNITLHTALSAAPAAAVVVYSTESFKPYDTGHTTVTLYVKHDDRVTKILGCIGSIKLTAEISTKAMYSFDFKGEWDNTQTSVGTNIAGYQLSKIPVACRSFRASHFGSTKLTLNKFEYDHSATPTEIKDGDAGYSFFVRESKASCPVTSRYKSTDAKTWQTAGTLNRLIVVTGNGAGDWVGCHGQAFVASTVGETEINKNVYNEIPFQFYDNQDSNDDKKPRLIRG